MAADGGGGDLASSPSVPPAVELHDADEEEWLGMGPSLFDEAEAEAMAKHERRMRREQEKAREEELMRARWEAHNTAVDRIRDYDPKQGGEYYTRYSIGADLSRLNLDEECESTAHQSIKCLILPYDESLILTGPKRGIISLDATYVEINLKIKDDQEQMDKELSKGYVSIRGARRATKRYELESRSLDTRLSTVEVIYGVVGGAVEATIEVEVVQGEFYGQITASPASIQNNNLVLHDSKVAGVMHMPGDGRGVVQLSRAVVAVCLKDTLSVTIISGTGDAKTEGTIIDFASRINRRDENEISLGDMKNAGEG
ncbi:hypothetical protein BAE44_0001256 [Dichanthelium oligosanthes]|uniref:DUF6598 domain-containing protein n=1 Tax=Dichanthelium oligosanthes TaxID=888268 RepID=A0A1E5WJY9_9POAL|nr:hypothetical protein BAE44_0001256 [Dichanthelium oligosanthes]